MGQLDPHEQVSIAKLLFLGGLVETVAKGSSAIAKGKVYAERWNLSVAECTLPRWVLRGVTLTIGERSMRISDDGSKIVRESEKSLI